MSDEEMIDEFLSEFARRLRFESRQSRRAIEEMKDHLLQATTELRREGLEPTEAARRAMERFGTPAELVERFEHEARFESEGETMFRYVLTALSALTVLFGMLFLVFSWLDDAPYARRISEIVAASMMIGCGIILVHQGWSSRPLAPWARWLVLAAALTSIVLGSMGAVFTAHLGLVTHDWEMYAFVVTTVLVLQGVLSVVDEVKQQSSPKPAG